LEDIFLVITAQVKFGA